MKVLTNTELHDEAQKLIMSGKMPSLEEVVKAVAEARKEYRAKVRFARLKKATVA